MISKPDFQHKKIIIIFLNKGEKMSFSNDNLVVKDKEGKIKHQSTCFRIFVVFLIGQFTLTTGIIQRAKKFGFTIVLMTAGLRVYEVISSKAEGNTVLREKQYQYDSLELPKYIVYSKIQSQMAAIKKARQHGQLPAEISGRLEVYKESLTDQKSLQSILGIEGSASKTYFQQIFTEMDWQGRQPRVKANPINCLLDTGYSFLFCFIEALLHCFGFDIYKGVYHRQFYMRKSLVCDLIEPFRPIIDYQIRKMYRLSQVKESDFAIINHQYKIAYKNSPEYVGLLIDPIIKRKDEIFVFIQSYYRCFAKERTVEHFPQFFF